MDVSTFYSALLFVFAVLLEFILILHNFHGTKENGGTIEYKNMKFSIIPFMSLATMCAIIWLVGSFSNIINFRLAWIVNEIDSTYELSFKPMIISNQLYVLIDAIFIIFIFYAMLKYSRRVRYRKYQGDEEGYYFDAERQSDFLLIGFAHPQLYVFYLFLFWGIGISMLLVILSCIPCVAISYAFRKNR
jgi:lysylphosphatidylglycerol synthetase-like protein (DUF2156 family)